MHRYAQARIRRSNDVFFGGGEGGGELYKAEYQRTILTISQS